MTTITCLQVLKILKNYKKFVCMKFGLYVIKNKNDNTYIVVF
jgi:hypothetical protein